MKMNDVEAAEQFGKSLDRRISALDPDKLQAAMDFPEIYQIRQRLETVREKENKMENEIEILEATIAATEPEADRLWSEMESAREKYERSRAVWSEKYNILRKTQETLAILKQLSEKFPERD